MDNLSRFIWAMLVIAVLVLIALILPIGLQPSPSTVTPGPTAACTEHVVNGGFETGGGWQFGASPAPPEVVTQMAHSGTHSLRLGITGGANVQSFSSARQTVSIPPNATQVTLSFWFYAIAEGPAKTDYMELVLFNQDGSVILAKPWRSHNDSRQWNRLAFDLNPWRGQTIQLYFNVYNDGLGGRAAMFLDDVSLPTCPATVTVQPGTVTPTHSPTRPTATSTPGCVPKPCATVSPPICTPVACNTATVTPGCIPKPCVTIVPPICTPIICNTATIAPTWSPTAKPTWSPTAHAGCQDLAQNGGFESGIAGWIPGNSPLPPTVVTDPVLAGSFSLQLGSQVKNRDAYSSIRQTISVPWGYARTIVSFWTYTWAESSHGSDRQQFVVLGPGDVVWATPWKVLENARAWQPHTFELKGMVGRTFDLYFAAVNDGKGGRTAFFLDEVHLWACAGDAMPAIPSYTTETGAAPGKTYAEPPAAVAAVPLILKATASPRPVETLPVAGSTPFETVPAAEITPVEALPTASITPVGTPPAADMTPVGTLSAAAGTAAETVSAAAEDAISGLPPGARWTEVAIYTAGPPTTTPPAAAMPGSTPGPAAAVPIAAPTPAAGLLQRITGAMANWPRSWWILAGILVLLVVLLIVWAFTRG